MNIKKFITEYTWLIVLVAIICGLLWPALGLIFKPYLSWLLMAMMVFSVLDVSFSLILKQIKSFRGQLLIVLIAHLVSPLLLLFIRPWLSPDLFLGLILASVSLVGLTNIFLSHLYGGLPSKALLIVSWSAIASPLTIPFLTWLFAQSIVKVDPWPMVVMILQLVFIPLVVATGLRHSRLYQPVKNASSYFIITFLFVIIFGTISSVQEIIVNNISLTLWLFGLISFLVVLNFSLGYLYGNKYEEKITYALCSSYKNFTVPVVLALTLFNPLVALPSAIYALVNNLMLLPLQLWFIPKFSPRKWYYLWLK